jgi:hypothetical protein
VHLSIQSGHGKRSTEESSDGSQHRASTFRLRSTVLVWHLASVAAAGRGLGHGTDSDGETGSIGAQFLAAYVTQKYCVRRRRAPLTRHCNCLGKSVKCATLDLTSWPQSASVERCGPHAKLRHGAARRRDLTGGWRDSGGRRSKR